MDQAVVIITGGAQGIGLSTTEALLRKGYKVCIADVDVVRATAVRKELADKYGHSNVLFSKCDVTSPADFSNVFREVLRTFDRVDVLINNAGILNENQWEKTIQINLNGTIIGCQTALKFMGKANGGKGGHVINIGSVLGLMPTPSVPVYTATKHAVVGLTRCYGDSSYLEKQGVRFNCVCPCHVTTELQAGWRNQIGQTNWPAMLKTEQIADAVIKVLEDGLNGTSLLVTIQGGCQYVGLPEIMKTVDLNYRTSD